MKKWLIIDGYNLLYGMSSHCMQKKQSLEEQREKIIKEVAEIGYLLAEKITIVFDGRSYFKRESFKENTIDVVFASQDLTADTIIIQLLKEYKLPQDVAVVSSDRIVAENASSLGAELMSAKFFIEWMENAKENLSARLNRQSAKKVNFTLGDIFPSTNKQS